MTSMYIPPEIQGTIVRALKPLIFDGLPVVIIAIPHRRYDALKVEKEMTGRIGPIDIPVWSLDELRFISHTGFRLLNCELPASVGTTFAEEAIGSPHLMQEFCRGICRLLGIDESIPAPDTLQFKVPLIKTVTRGYAIQGVSRGGTQNPRRNFQFLGIELSTRNRTDALVLRRCRDLGHILPWLVASSIGAPREPLTRLLTAIPVWSLVGALVLLHGKDVRPVEISRICFEHRTCGKLTTRRSPVSFGAGTLELHLDRQADPAGAAR